MKAKAKYGLVILLVTVLVLVAGGGEAVAQVGAKTTGGGWFTYGDGEKITFGFNARPIGDEEAAEGEFQMVDHGSKTNIHGTFDRIVGTPAWSLMTGKCTIDGEGDYSLFVWCEDGDQPEIARDCIEIHIIGYGSYYGFLEGGNIQVHKAEEE